MKRFKQVIAILLSACMLAGTAACGPTTASLTPATPDGAEPLSSDEVKVR